MLIRVLAPVISLTTSSLPPSADAKLSNAVNGLEVELDKTTETATEALEKINSATNPARMLIIRHPLL